MSALGGTSLLPSPGGQRSHPPFGALHVGVACGSYKGGLEMFSLLPFFLKKSISIQPIPGKPQSPQQSPSPSVLENTHFSLLPLASVDLFQAAITFSGKEYGAEAFINGWGRQAPVV